MALVTRHHLSRDIPVRREGDLVELLRLGEGGQAGELVPYCLDVLGGVNLEIKIILKMA